MCGFGCVNRYTLFHIASTEKVCIFSGHEEKTSRRSAPRRGPSIPRQGPLQRHADRGERRQGEKARGQLFRATGPPTFGVVESVAVPSPRGAAASIRAS